MSLTTNAIAQIRARLADPQGRTDEQLMDSILRLSGMWRSLVLASTVVGRDGLAVQHGPFAGMQYVRNASEGALLPRLIGSYESELHPHILAFAEEGLTDVIDVGCAEGYYAVGLARLMPQVTVHAFDTDPAAREGCIALAERNGVSDRVKVAGEFAGEDFANYPPGKTLVFMDIEGAERNLLDPQLYPGLLGLSVIVETHPIPTQDLTALIIGRFSATHDIVRLTQGPKTTPLPVWLRQLSHMDQLLAGWEWRTRPTPWLVMRPKKPAG
jgi:hypothetical protein